MRQPFLQRDLRPEHFVSPSTAPAVTSRHWALLFAIAAFFVTVSAVSYMVSDPVPIGWDEADYVNRALLDQAALRRGPKPFVGQLLKEETFRPPAYRILHVPFTLAIGVTAPSLRLVCFAGLLLTLWLVYLAVSELAGPSAGTFAAIFILPLPAVLGSVTWFSTEYALYLAIAGSLWSLVRLVHPDSRRNEYLLLGCFLGLGLLAKITFIVVASPLLAVVTLARIGGFVERPRVANLAKATVMGLLIAFPWYALNARAALWYASFASNFVRHSLPYSSLPARTVGYVALVIESGFGYCLAALGAVTCYLALRQRTSGRVDWGHGRGVVALACTASAFGVLCVQLLSRNQNWRYAAPGLILAGAALGVVAGVTSLVTRRRFFALSCCLVLCQVGLMLTRWGYDGFYSASIRFGQPPSKLFQREPGWNWEALRVLCLNRLRDKPHLRIGHLGSGAYLVPPQITHPWIVYKTTHPASEPNTDVEVTWLWRYEDGPLDWLKLTQSLDRFDVLLTAPHLVGQYGNKEHLDNEHNAEFAARLVADSRFAPPVVIRLVENGPDVYVYFRNEAQ